MSMDVDESLSLASPSLVSSAPAAEVVVEPQLEPFLIDERVFAAFEHDLLHHTNGWLAEELERLLASLSRQLSRSGRQLNRTPVVEELAQLLQREVRRRESTLSRQHNRV